MSKNKGIVFFRVTFEAGSKNISMPLFMPSEDREYNPKAVNSIKLESFLNATLDLNISPANDNYSEQLMKGLEYFTKPKLFEGRECHIKVDYPYSALFADKIGENQFQLKNGKGELLDLGDGPDDTVYETRDAVETAVALLNDTRDDDKQLRFSKYPEVMFINPPKEMQDVPALDTQLEDVEDEDDADGF